jgi:predicted SnoaL-like aldol condensation-catalyzing enzyme
MNKFIKPLLLAGSVAIASVFSASANANELKEKAVGILEQGLLKGDKEFINRNVAEGYIQHNPTAPDGRAGLLGYVDYAQSLKPNLSINPVRVLQDGDLVAIQSEYDLGGKTIVFDLFRFKDGKAVEHWDAIQPKPEKTVSGRSMTDGTTEISDRDKTDENREFVRNFVTDILVNGEDDKITQYIGDTYMQHNPNIGDGLDGLGKFLGTLKENNVSFSYKKIHNIVAEGNFVMTQSEGEIGGKTNAFFDLFRIENGKIVEHWDVIQAVPSEMAHENGMF